MSDSAHLGIRMWPLSYMGMPWGKGKRGPEQFDCWGFVYTVYRNEFNTELPLYPAVDSSDFSLVKEKISEGFLTPFFEQLENPIDGCIVALSKNKDYLHHVGIFLEIDGGAVIHCTPKNGVICQPFRSLSKWGYKRVEFFIFRGTTKK